MGVSCPWYHEMGPNIRVSGEENIFVSEEVLRERAQIRNILPSETPPNAGKQNIRAMDSIASMCLEL